MIVVRRCKDCGATVRSEAAAVEPTGMSRKRPPIDEGPPDNPVLDPETAARLLSGDS